MNSLCVNINLKLLRYQARRHWICTDCWWFNPGASCEIFNSKSIWKRAQHYFKPRWSCCPRMCITGMAFNNILYNNIGGVLYRHANGSLGRGYKNNRSKSMVKTKLILRKKKYCFVIWNWFLYYIFNWQNDC